MHYCIEQLIRNKQAVLGRLIEEGACTLGFPRIREGLRRAPWLVTGIARSRLGVHSTGTDVIVHAATMIHECKQMGVN